MIKAILLCGLASAALLQFRAPANATTLAMRRALFCSVIAVGAGAVLFPSAVTAVANSVGVVRGTDLVLYLFVVLFLLTSVSYSRRLYELEEKYVLLARHIALDQARGDILADRKGDRNPVLNAERL
jgi:hypothetical protein